MSGSRPAAIASAPTARLAGYYFWCFAYVGVFAPYFPLHLQALSMSAWQIAVVLAAMQSVRIVAPYAWGAAADRHIDRMLLVRISSALTLVAFAALSLVSSFWAVLAIMLCVSIAWSPGLPLMESVTMGHLGTHTAYYGRIRLWGSIGFIAAVMVVGRAMESLAAEAVVWFCLLPLLGVLLSTLTIAAVPRSASARPAPSIVLIVRREEVAATLAAGFFMAAAHAALYTFYSIHLARNGYTESWIGLYWSIGVVAEIGVFIAMPYLLRQFGLRRLLIACYACAALRFLMIGVGVGSPTLLAIAQVLHGITFGAFHAASLEAVHRWFPGDSHARGQALYSSITFGAGGLLGGLASGALWEAAGAAMTFGLSSAAACIGAFLIVWKFRL